MCGNCAQRIKSCLSCTVCGLLGCVADQIKHRLCGFVLWWLLVGTLGAGWIYQLFEKTEQNLFSYMATTATNHLRYGNGAQDVGRRLLDTQVAQAQVRGG